MARRLSDKALIEYCNAHCESDSPTFKKDHVIRMAALAGVPLKYGSILPKKVSMRAGMKELVRLAKERELKEVIFLNKRHSIRRSRKYERGNS